MSSDDAAVQTGEGAVFKAGFLVVDLEAAMRDFSAWLGVEWTPVQQAPLTLETASGREAVGVDAQGNAPALFAFHRGAHGLRVELVDSRSRENFEGWLAGGALELG